MVEQKNKKYNDKARKIFKIISENLSILFGEEKCKNHMRCKNNSYPK